MGKVLTTPTLSPFKFGSPFAKTAISLAIAATFSSVVVPVEAAGLGRLTVSSALGQPLKAQIEITSLTEDEAASLSARLARPEAFRQAGLEYNPALTGLEFRIINNGTTRSIVEISSTRAINEPFVDLLVELTWASGKFVREYTFLLDPPELRLAQPDATGGAAAATPIVTPAQVPASAVRAAAGQAAGQPADQAQAAAAATAAAAAARQGNAAGGAAPLLNESALADRAATLRDRRLQQQAPAQVLGSTPSPAAAQAAGSTAAAATPAAVTPSPTAAPAAATASTRTVQRGETLAGIAREFTNSADVNQVMVALYRRNPDAFFGSIHQLRAGAQLEVPSAEQMAAVSQVDALAEIRTSNDAWRDYRARLADVAGASAVPATPAGTATAAVGTIGEARDTTGATGTATDSLKLSRDTTGVANEGASATGASDNASEERSVARQAALSDAQARVTELESNVAKLQELLELKNQQLADLNRQVGQATTGAEQAATAAAAQIASAQADARAATEKALADKAAAEEQARQALADKEAAEKAAAEKVQAARIEAERAAADRLAEARAGATGGDTAGAAAAGAAGAAAMAGAAAGSMADAAGAAAGNVADAAGNVADAAGSAVDGAATMAGDAAAGVSDAAQTAADQAAQAVREAAGTAADTAESTAAAAVAPTPAPAAAPVGMFDSVMSSLTSNPLVPAGAAGLIALAGFFAWRKRKVKPAEDKFEDTLGGDDAFAANSLFGTTGGQDVDTSNSLFNTSVGVDSSVDVHSTEVDPIAEAEVYIAYGREAQAEEILKEALKRQPDRQAIRLKLLEIYAGRKDPIAYGALAREMHDVTGGHNEEWPKVITMGLSIDPENPLYTSDSDAPTGTAGFAAAAGAAAAGAAGISALSGQSDDDFRTRPGPGVADDDLPTLALDDDGLKGMDPEVDARADEQFGSLDFDLDINTGAQTSMGLTSGNSESPASARNADDMPTLDFENSSFDADTAIAGLDDMNMEVPTGTGMRTSGLAGGGAEGQMMSAGMDMSGDVDLASDDSSQWQEMATKLDLASAYEEIGDKEGARELLEEVLKGGDDGQQQKARLMLSKIS